MPVFLCVVAVMKVEAQRWTVFTLGLGGRWWLGACPGPARWPRSGRSRSAWPLRSRRSPDPSSKCSLLRRRREKVEKKSARGGRQDDRPWASTCDDQTCDPVDGDALHSADAVGDHVLPPGLVSFGPADGAQAHVHPVDGVVLCENKAKVFLSFLLPPCWYKGPVICPFSGLYQHPRAQWSGHAWIIISNQWHV